MASIRENRKNGKVVSYRFTQPAWSGTRRENRSGNTLLGRLLKLCLPQKRERQRSGKRTNGKRNGSFAEEGVIGMRDSMVYAMFRMKNPVDENDPLPAGSAIHMIPTRKVS